MAANYEKGEVTDRERLAQERLREISKHNYDAAKEQLEQKLANYDLAEKQNRALADAELQEADRKNASERFGQLRKLQSTVASLMSSAGNALAGSGTDNLLRMIADRNDLDDNSAFESLATNRDQIENAFNESQNQNRLAYNEALINAQKAFRDLQADLAAQTNSINPNLYIAPKADENPVYAQGTYDNGKRDGNFAKASGYFTPANDSATKRTRRPNPVNNGNGYYDRLVNAANKYFR